MLYAKNLPTVERGLRVLSGVALIAEGLLGKQGLVVSSLLVAGGIVAIVTGFVGFCPLCALVGRRSLQAIRKQREEKTL